MLSSMILQHRLCVIADLRPCPRLSVRLAYAAAAEVATSVSPPPIALTQLYAFVVSINGKHRP
jgi:hypothetical protein